MRGDRLKYLRERSNLTQEALSEALGRDIKQVWRWETGKVNPTSDAVVQLAEYFMVSSDYLLGLTDTPTEVTGDDISPLEREVLNAVRVMGARDLIIIIELIRIMTDENGRAQNIQRRDKPKDWMLDDDDPQEIQSSESQDKSLENRMKRAKSKNRVYTAKSVESQLETILKPLPDKTVRHLLSLAAELANTIARANPFTLSTDHWEEFSAWFDPLDIVRQKLVEECDKRGIDIDSDKK